MREREPMLQVRCDTCGRTEETLAAESRTLAEAGWRFGTFIFRGVVFDECPYCSGAFYR